MTVLGMILKHSGIITLTFEVFTPRGVTRSYDYSILVCDTQFGRNIMSQMTIILILTTCEYQVSHYCTVQLCKT